MLPSLVPLPSWAGEFFASYMVKLGLQIILCVYVCARACVYMHAESMFQGLLTY